MLVSCGERRMRIVRQVKMTFRTTRNIKAWLERKAKENRRSVNSEIEAVVLAAKAVEHTRAKSEPV